jgi:DNA-binding MarR family transcriptional regulator
VPSSAVFEGQRTTPALTESCLVTPQAMMILLKTMEQRGLISRSPHPRRPNVLELRMTDVGRDALQVAHERVEPIEQGVFGVFSAKDLSVFRELLSRFIDAFDEARARDARPYVWW